MQYAKIQSILNDWNQFYSSDYTGNGGANIPYLEVRYTTNFEAMTEGTYYIQNVYTGKYLCASGSSVYLSDYGSGGTAVRWTIQQNSYYPSTYNIVPNGNTSLGLYFNMDYGTITLPAKASDGFGRWQFEKLDNGMYLILSAGRPWMSLAGSGTSVYPSVANTDTPQQWRIIIANNNIGYGIQTFREISSNQYIDINCHGYAMLREDWPRNWLLKTNDYLESIQTETITQYYKYSLYALSKEDFETWLTDNNYVYEYESDFSGNGESRYLASNQYRVVFRVGYQTVISIDGNLINQYDYHLWYQLYNGRWAHKRGINEPELLEVGTTPFSTNTTGWQLFDYNVFYDSPVYSYIITIS